MELPPSGWILRSIEHLEAFDEILWKEVTQNICRLTTSMCAAPLPCFAALKYLIKCAALVAALLEPLIR
jgi:hypothetical protein